MNKTKIIVICGPTASGKSRLAVALAKHFGGEIINADSMQVYRGMDIATASPSETDKTEISHHLFGIIDISQPFSVAEWLVLAREKIAEVAERGNIPIIVGGTGLYISGLVDNIIFDEIGEDSDFRAEMHRLADEKGNAFLLNKLREVDSEAASRLHENNVKRIIRALETYNISGKLSGERLEKSRAECSPYDVVMLAIDFPDRKLLYDRIDSRVDAMVSDGLIDEAKRCLFDVGIGEKTTSSQAIGHKELLPFFKEECGLDECIDNLKRKTRNYAKRQLTWFRKSENTYWLIIDAFTEYDTIYENAINLLKEIVKKV